MHCITPHHYPSQNSERRSRSIYMLNEGIATITANAIAKDAPRIQTQHGSWYRVSLGVRASVEEEEAKATAAEARLPQPHPKGRTRMEKNFATAVWCPIG